MHTLAVISGDALLNAIIWIVVAGVAFWLLGWLIDYCGLPQPFNKVAKVVLAVAAVIICLNALFSMAGRPFIRW